MDTALRVASHVDYRLVLYVNCDALQIVVFLSRSVKFSALLHTSNSPLCVCDIVCTGFLGSWYWDKEVCFQEAV